MTGRARGHDYRVVGREEVFHGAVFNLVSEDVAMPGGGTARRDFTQHRPAAAVVALDDDGRVVLVHQYRPAVHRYLWELPAGIMDKPGEAAVAAAARELAEETDLVAARWDVLLDVHSSPGHSDELVRVFLARDLSAVPAARRYARADEEADLTVTRFELAEAVAMVLRGELTNGPGVAGILAAQHARDTGWAGLRPADTPLPA